MMITTPTYLYGTTGLPSVNDGYLFHYTKFENFLKIIETMTLRSSALSKMNDLNEASMEFVDPNKDSRFIYQAKQYIKNNCSIICFTRNYMNGEICEEGSNHPAMWSHYAEDSNGVCVVFDEVSLINNNKMLLADVFYKIKDVEYCYLCSPDSRILKGEYSDLSDFLRKNYAELFFKKHVDWSYEKETRLLIEQPEVFLNIKGAIRYIILGGRLKNDEEKVRKIIDLMISPQSNAYKYLDPHSFEQVLRSPYGYFVATASHIIYNQLTRMSRTSSLAKSYLDWFNCKKQSGIE